MSVFYLGGAICQQLNVIGKIAKITALKSAYQKELKGKIAALDFENYLLKMFANNNAEKLTRTICYSMIMAINSTELIAVEEKVERQASQNGKYALILYLVENKKLTIQEIIDITPQKALELLPSEDEYIMEELKKYLASNVNKIKKNENRYFFPGQKGKASARSILHELHFYLKPLGLSLKDFGLPSRPPKVNAIEEMKKIVKPEDIMNWAKKILN